MNILELALLIQRSLNLAGHAAGLIRTMNAEGRSELTADELAGLKAQDDSARDELVQAIARAQAEGR